MSRLTEFLVSSGQLSAADLARARAEAASVGRRIAAELVDMGLIPEKALAGSLTRLTALPLVDPLPEEIPPEVLRKVPPGIGRELEVVPLYSEDGVLRVAMIDPSDEVAIGILRSTVAMKVAPVIALRGEVARAIDRFYPEEPEADITLSAPPGSRLELDSGKQPAPSVQPPPVVFEVGNDTLLRSFAEPLEIPEEDVGSRTLATPPLRPPATPSQLLPSDPFSRLLQLTEEHARRIDQLEKRLEELLARSRR